MNQALRELAYRQLALFLSSIPDVMPEENDGQPKLGPEISNKEDGQVILVVEDVEETRDGIERLLRASGYRVEAARNEEDAVTRAQHELPALILVSLTGLSANVIATARRIRERAELDQEVPVVIFCVENVEEGAEVEIGGNVHLTRPDNFNQLRILIRFLLSSADSSGF